MLIARVRANQASHEAPEEAARASSRCSSEFRHQPRSERQREQFYRDHRHVRDSICDSLSSSKVTSLPCGSIKSRFPSLYDKNARSFSRNDCWSIISHQDCSSPLRYPPTVVKDARLIPRYRNIVTRASSSDSMELLGEAVAFLARKGPAAAHRIRVTGDCLSSALKKLRLPVIEASVERQ